jgi:hypothetical protein
MRLTHGLPVNDGHAVLADADRVHPRRGRLAAGTAWQRFGIVRSVRVWRVVWTDHGASIGPE